MGRVNVQTSTDRSTLVEALCSVSAIQSQSRAQPFLEGLSGDELRYIAEFVGASLLDPDLKAGHSRNTAAARIERFQKASPSHADSRQTANRMIVLLEYLSLTGFRSGSQTRAARIGVA